MGRVFRAAKAADHPVEMIEFCVDGSVIVRPKVAMSSTAKPEPNDFDDGNDQAEVRQ
jgi:hypothetical protein